jgi:hypothetical protein
MPTNKLCVRISLVDPLAPTANVFANPHPILDARQSGGRPASLKHFGYNVSPPLTF